jgi:hypothetical protein
LLGTAQELPILALSLRLKRHCALVYLHDAAPDRPIEDKHIAFRRVFAAPVKAIQVFNGCTFDHSIAKEGYNVNARDRRGHLFGATFGGAGSSFL